MENTIVKNNRISATPRSKYHQYGIYTGGKSSNSDTTTGPTITNYVRLTGEKSQIIEGNVAATGNIVAYQTNPDIDIKLPKASKDSLGAIKVGDNLTISDDGTLSAIASQGGASTWDELLNKPDVFPPTSHTHTKSEITDFAHTHTKSEITDFAHTHNYTSTVKLGNTNYNVNNNVISLPAYPTELKCPNSLSIIREAVNDRVKDTTSYDGSQSKSVTIHGHTNKNNLDTINQNLGTGYTPTFTGMKSINGNPALTSSAGGNLYTVISSRQNNISSSSADCFWKMIHADGSNTGGAPRGLSFWSYNGSGGGANKVLEIGAYQNGSRQNYVKTTGNMLSTGNVVAYSTGNADISLPYASKSSYGAIKVGNNLSVSNGVLNANPPFNGGQVNGSIDLRNSLNISGYAWPFMSLTHPGATRCFISERSDSTMYFCFGDTSTHKASLGSTGNLYIAGKLTQGSDARLKIILDNVDNVVDKIQNINTYKFVFKNNDDKIPHIGVLAQEVKEQFPEVVTTSWHEDVKESYYAVDYGVLGAVVSIAGVKELNQKIIDQQKQIDELKAIVNDLNKLLHKNDITK